MKKYLFLLVTLTTLFTNAYGDGMTATLQQGGKMTPYYGINALKDAYNAADSGAVIILSPGLFNNLGTISKPITIIGTHGFSSTTSTSTVQTDLTISADSVTIEGIYFSGTVTLGGVQNCHIKRCYIISLTSTANHTNTQINQCVIRNDAAVGKGINYRVCNSTIEKFSTINSSANKAYIANCVIYYWASADNSSNPTSLSTGYRQPFAIYINNVLGCRKYSNTANMAFSVSTLSEFYNNVFYGHYTNSSSGTLTVSYPEGCVNRGNTTQNTTSAITYTYPNTTATWGTGIDGTPIGLTGGQGFVAYPSIPRITSSTIDGHTDAEGKINVKVSVAVPE